MCVCALNVNLYQAAWLEYTAMKKICPVAKFTYLISFFFFLGANQQCKFRLY